MKCVTIRPCPSDPSRYWTIPVGSELAESPLGILDASPGAPEPAKPLRVHDASLGPAIRFMNERGYACQFVPPSGTVVAEDDGHAD